VSAATIGILATAFVGVVGIVFPYLTRRGDREHERALSRAERVYALRLDLYSEWAQELERWRVSAIAVHPLIGPVASPPELLAQEELIALFARLQVGASAEIVAVSRLADEQNRAFYGDGGMFEAVDRDRGAENWVEARRAMDASRGRLFAAIEAAEKAMCDELNALG
jgi:hypothetical protein